MSEANILFGHQDDTKNGYGWTNNQGSPISLAKSDVKDVTGAYPAVYGWDFKDIANFDSGAWFEHEKRGQKILRCCGVAEWQGPLAIALDYKGDLPGQDGGSPGPSHLPIRETRQDKMVMM